MSMQDEDDDLADSDAFFADEGGITPAALYTSVSLGDMGAVTASTATPAATAAARHVGGLPPTRAVGRAASAAAAAPAPAENDADQDDADDDEEETGLNILLPRNRTKNLLWAVVFSNPEELLGLLGNLEKVVGGTFTFTAEVAPGTAEDATPQTGLKVDDLVQNNSMFVSAYLQSQVEMYDAAGSPSFGRHRVSVTMATLMLFMRGVSGNMNFAMYQTRHNTAQLHLHAQDGADSQHVALPLIGGVEDVPGMPPMEFAYQIKVQVDKLKRQVSQLERYARDGATPNQLDLRYCKVPREPDSFLLILQAKGVAGYPAEFCTHIRTVATLQAREDEEEGARAPLGNTCGEADRRPPTKHVLRATRDTTRLPCDFADTYPSPLLGSVLSGMRGDAYVDMCMGGVETEPGQAPPQLPMLLRMGLGMSSYIAFCISPIITDED